MNEVQTLTLRMPVKVYEKLKKEAKERGISLNAYILLLVNND